MTRLWLAAAAVGGFVCVAAGAFAAHFAAGDRTAELLRTGALYGIVHAAALIGVTAVAGAQTQPGAALTAAGWSFVIGIALFSFSLFALALTGFVWLGVVTPFGGVGLLAGWAALAVEALRHRR